MNRRQKKKLEKRRGYFRYAKFKEWKRILDFGMKHGGQTFYEWFVEGKHRSEAHKAGTGVDMLLITTSKSGKAIKHMKIVQGCYPSAMTSSDDASNITLSFTADFHNGECTTDVFQEVYNRYQEWLGGIQK
jgi:hypothetical protein